MHCSNIPFVYTHAVNYEKSLLVKYSDLSKNSWNDKKIKHRKNCQTVDKVILVQRKVLGNEEFSKWNPQTGFTSVEENSLVMTFTSESGFATMLSCMVNSFKAF